VSGLRLLLADDDAVFTAAMADLLGAREDVDLVGVVADGAAALQVLEEHDVDLALLDVDMPVLDGIATARRIAREWPRVRVVMLTAFEQPDSLGRALGAGASGFLTKDMPVDRLVSLLHEVVMGATVMGPRPATLLADSYRDGNSRGDRDPEFTSSVEALPGRYREVFDLLTHAASNRVIARELHLSEGTARVYASKVLQLTGCRSRAELALRALGARLG
jgi:Response regulator containing a CheY-like receiver domain and an HTH DNA-binding domain